MNSCNYGKRNCRNYNGCDCNYLEPEYFERRPCNCDDYNSCSCNSNLCCEDPTSIDSDYDYNPNNCGRISDISKLPLNLYLCYKSIAFDGCNYYLTLPEVSKIAVFNKRFCFQTTIDTSHKFEGLTYNPNENVFYATVSGNTNSIYKLDRNFKKLLIIPFNIPASCCPNICSISFNCQTNHIVLVVGGEICEIDKTGKFVGKVPVYESQVCCVTCLSPYYVCVISRNGRQFLKIVDPSSCCDSCEIRLPHDLRIQSIAFNEEYGCRNVKLVALAKKNCQCNYLVKIKCCNLSINSCNNLCCCCYRTSDTDTMPVVNETTVDDTYNNDNVDSETGDIPNCPYHD